MEQAEIRIWVILTLYGGAGLAVFTTGLFALNDRHYVFGALFTVVGVMFVVDAGRRALGHGFKISNPVLAVMLVLTWIFLGIDFYDRHYRSGNSLDCPGCAAWDDNAPLERVYSQKFENQTVPLDGLHYVNPVFDNVTFDFEGTGQSQMDNATFVNRPDGEVRLRSRNKVVTQTMAIMHNFETAKGCNVSLTYSVPDKTWTVTVPQPK